MSGRKMSRRTALALTMGAAAGAAILSDAKPADATWPTITSPTDLISAANAVAGAAAPTSRQPLSTKPRIYTFQGHAICSWDDVETILLAAANAVSQFKEQPGVDSHMGDAWFWKKHHPSCPPPRHKKGA